VVVPGRWFIRHRANPQIKAFATGATAAAAWPDIAAVASLSAASVLLWRLSANMPQLNSDGLNGFSANDWAAPAHLPVPQPLR
jgi:hypothetical protein